MFRGTARCFERGERIGQRGSEPNLSGKRGWFPQSCSRRANVLQRAGQDVAPRIGVSGMLDSPLLFFHLNDSVVVNSAAVLADV